MDIEYVDSPLSEPITIDCDYYTSDTCEHTQHYSKDLLIYPKFIAPERPKRRTPPVIKLKKKVLRK